MDEGRVPWTSPTGTLTEVESLSLGSRRTQASWHTPPTAQAHAHAHKPAPTCTASVSGSCWEHTPHLQLTGLQQPARLGFRAWQWLPTLQPPIGHPALRPHPALLPLGVWLRPLRLPWDQPAHSCLCRTETGLLQQPLSEMIPYNPGSTTLSLEENTAPFHK